ncbi:MAG: hypothetical protein ABR565_09480, partial [Gammaproteobacteria bacterium]
SSAAQGVKPSSDVSSIERVLRGWFGSVYRMAMAISTVVSDDKRYADSAWTCAKYPVHTPLPLLFSGYCRGDEVIDMEMHG